MPTSMVEIRNNTSRKSRCHNCNRVIEGIEKRLVINYPHPTGFRYYYICKDCGLKILGEFQKGLF